MKSIETLIAIIKRDKNYKIEVSLSIYDLTVTIMFRGVQVIRGLLLRLFVRGNGLIFKGKAVQLQYKKYITIGKSCVLEDFVFINGLSQQGIILENNVTIARGATLVGSGVIRNKGIGIKIGSNSAIGTNNFLAGQGGIFIGENVIIGPDVKIFSENHIFNKEHIPIRAQGESRKGVKINDNCWIGAGAIILDGVELAYGTVVAAGAVVTKSFKQKNIVIGGVPAVILKSRLD